MDLSQTFTDLLTNTAVSYWDLVGAIRMLEWPSARNSADRCCSKTSDDLIRADRISPQRHQRGARQSGRSHRGPDRSRAAGSRGAAAVGAGHGPASGAASPRWRIRLRICLKKSARPRTIPEAIQRLHRAGVIATRRLPGGAETRGGRARAAGTGPERSAAPASI